MCERASGAREQHLDPVHELSPNPCFPAGICTIAYPSALMAIGVAAASELLDGAPSQGGQQSHP